MNNFSNSRNRGSSLVYLKIGDILTMRYRTHSPVEGLQQKHYRSNFQTLLSHQTGTSPLVLSKIVTCTRFQQIKERSCDSCIQQWFLRDFQCLQPVTVHQPDRAPRLPLSHLSPRSSASSTSIQGRLDDHPSRCSGVGGRIFLEQV